MYTYQPKHNYFQYSCCLTLVLFTLFSILTFFCGLFVTFSGQYEILGETRDDAIGEAYDKVGVLLGVQPRPNECFGAAVEREALLYVSIGEAYDKVGVLLGVQPRHHGCFCSS